MFNVQCCFCDQGISEDDGAAVIITVKNLWNRGEEGFQEMFSHSTCVTEQLGSLLSPSVPFDVDEFRD